jgi:hypothetical protein
VRNFLLLAIIKKMATSKNDSLPALADLLADASIESLRTLVETLVKRQPALLDDVLRALTLPLATSTNTAKATASKTVTTLPPVHLEAMRRQIKRAFKELDYQDYHSDSAIDDFLTQLIDDTQKRFEQGDTFGTLAMLDVITEEFVDEEFYNYGNGEVDFTSVGMLWAEALLAFDLPAETRTSYLPKLEKWYEEISDYGHEGLEFALMAAKNGWDRPEIQQILQGKMPTDKINWREKDWGYSTIVRMQAEALNTAGKPDTALLLATYAEFHDIVCLSLIALDRLPEAVAETKKRSLNNESLLRIVVAMNEKDAEEAYRLGLAILDKAVANDNQAEDEDRAEWAEEEEEEEEREGEMPSGFGMVRTRRSRHYTIEYYPSGASRLPLLRWLRNVALIRTDIPVVLQMGSEIVRLQPNSKDWDLLKSHATTTNAWEAMREGLLNDIASHAKKYTYEQEKPIEILLDEGWHRQAWESIKESYSAELVMRVADHVISEQPQEVRLVAQKHAESIMDNGRSNDYELARDWLLLTRDGFRGEEKETDWETYKANLLKTHARKYKLVPLIKEIL